MSDISNRQNPAGRPAAARTTSTTFTPNKGDKPNPSIFNIVKCADACLLAPQPSLTTDYTPLQRGVITPKNASTPQPNTAAQSTSYSTPQHDISTHMFTGSEAPEQRVDDGPDPSTLPPATAPPSHPKIDPTVAGTLDGRSILDVDLGAMAEKPWRRPGSDLSDWFNYGFDEISWEAYCYRRRDLGELGNVLKVNVMVYSSPKITSVLKKLTFYYPSRILQECQKTSFLPYHLNYAQWL